MKTSGNYNQTSTRRLARLALVALLASSHLLTNCGSEDKEEDKTAPVSPTTTAQPTTPTTPTAPAATSGCTVISDLDDTLKLTDVQSTFSKYINAFSTLAFLDMHTLVRSILTGNATFIVLTGSPSLISGTVDGFFPANNFPIPKATYMRDSIFEDVKTFKTNKLNTIMPTLNASPCLVMIGDDTEVDAEVYAGAKSSFGQKPVTTYIHIVKGGTNLLGAQGYTLAFDIAFYEMKAGRMTADVANKIGMDLLSHWNDEVVFPEFKVCPATSYSLPVSAADGAIQTTYQQIKARVAQACASHPKKQ